jgi:peptidoglycan/LPS O-acetylase OafA/YrhL
VVVTLVMAVTFVYLAVKDTWVARVLGTKPMSWFGKRTYGMYLYNYPLTALLGTVFASRLATAGLEIAATIATAAISYRFIESPALRLKDRFEPKLARTPVDKPVTAAM